MTSNCKGQHPENNCCFSSQKYPHLNRTGLCFFSTDPKGEFIPYFFITSTDARLLGICSIFQDFYFVHKVLKAKEN